MKSKSNYLILFVFFCTCFYSQERFGSSEKALNKIKNSSLQICTQVPNDELNETFKAACEKYWTFCPIEFVDYEARNKDLPHLLFADYEIKSWTLYTWTEIGMLGSNWINYTCHFDNLTVKGECFGIDNSNEAMKYKINLTLLNLAAQVKFLDNAYKENKTKGINSWEGYKERLKTTKILIPKEYLSNGITKNAFKKIKKYEIVPLEDINKRILENNTKGYSVLNTYISPAGSFFNIIDLETGDYIYRHDFGMAFGKGMVGKPDKISDKDLIKIIDKMND